MLSLEQQKRRGTEKTQSLSSQVPYKLANIDKASMMKGRADRKTCCHSPVYRLRD